MEINIIVAVDNNYGIGKDGKIPWYLPEDLKYFKETTMGYTVIMGRKTWDSIGKPLPGRRNIVISRNKELTLEGADVFESLDAALLSINDDKVFVIGGNDIYRMALPIANKIYLTKINITCDVDTYFPKFDWNEVSVINGRTDGVTFHIYEP